MKKLFPFIYPFISNKLFSLSRVRRIEILEFLPFSSCYLINSISERLSQENYQFFGK